MSHEVADRSPGDAPPGSVPKPARQIRRSAAEDSPPVPSRGSPPARGRCAVYHGNGYKSPRLILAGLLLAALTLAGCDALKGPELSLTADRTTISAGGHEYAVITATVYTKGSPAVGVEVEFSTETGSFSSSDDVASQYVATDSEGKATVQLFSPLTQGQTEVTATYSDEESGVDAVDRLTIVFGPPQAGNLPVDGRFHLECMFLNIGAFRTPKPDIEVPCNLSAQTSQGDILQVDSLNVFFLAEAGTLTTVADQLDYNVVYSVMGGHPEPVDVDPVSGEPSRTGSLGEEHNPRDGVVTLLAITAGTESWTDINGNGVRDENEPFEDIGEPFLDVDDNGEFDIGEEYWDSNGDGEWTGPNGQFDSDTFIGAQAKVIWTGPLAEAADAARLETNPVNTVLGDGGQMTISVWLLDERMNPIASFAENSDTMTLSDTSYNLAFNPDYEVLLDERLGMSFDSETGGILEFYYNSNCIQAAGCYQIGVSDAYGGTIEDPPLPYIVSVSLYTTPGPQLDDWPFQEQSWFVQNITGTTE
ncbi:MAG: hypothetical protein ABI333_01410 [bacterium]